MMAQHQKIYLMQIIAINHTETVREEKNPNYFNRRKKAFHTDNSLN